jgi:anti-sigma factor RsiW
MTCDETDVLLTAFVDGELRGGEMRDVARHLAQCRRCEAESAELECVQRRVRDAVALAVAVPDADRFWGDLARGLDSSRRPVRARVAVTANGWRAAVFARPLWIGSAIAAVLVVALMLSALGPEDPIPPRNALVSADPAGQARQARIDALEAPGNVRVWNTADRGALVIWVDDAGFNMEPLDP